MLPFYFEWPKVSALTWHTALPPHNKETIIISSTCYRQKNQFLSDKMDSCNISEEKEPSINYPSWAEPAASAPLSREFVRNAKSQAPPQTFWIRISILIRNQMICVHINDWGALCSRTLACQLRNQDRYRKQQ